MEPKRSFNTSQVARYCHVSPDTIRDWANRRILRMFRTPGGHRRITREDLIRFLREQNMPVDRELLKRARRVLVVDDLPDVAEALARMVKEVDKEIEVETANSGFDAGRTLQTFEPDLVLLDLKMPNMDGFEVCKQIKSDPKTAHVAVIGVTGVFTEEESIEIIRLGAAAVLHKPISLETLRDTLESVLGSAVT